MPFYEITEDLCWSDDVSSMDYNAPFKMQDIDQYSTQSYEKMWREDHRYDIVIVVDHNMNPAIPGRGSAIFIHCNDGESEPYQKSRGCLKLKKEDLLTILLSADTRTVWDLTKILA